MINIRYGTAPDAASITAISRQTFYDSFAGQNTAENMQKHLDSYYLVSKLKDELDDQLNTFILATEDEEIIGYAKMNDSLKSESRVLQNPIEIERIYAVKMAIGKGVGSALMKHCIDIAIQKRKATIWLGVWEHNHRAIDFYTKWGFEKFGQHVFEVGDDPQTDWLMKKQL